ncbi:MAG: hypothetical protein HKN47_14870 [Pirellulaceae bacterium]|nr:hypothetical protein [Pirellulaceae bacterium]
MASRENLAKARLAKEKAMELYGDWKAVNGIGISNSNGSYAIKINLESERTGGKKIKESIDGIPVVVKRVGAVVKQ